MTWLYPSLLFGLAAAAVPVVLHLTGSRPPRPVTIGSIRLLRRRYESTRSTLRVKRWWLLACRVAAAAAAAGALAAPMASAGPIGAVMGIGGGIAALAAAGLAVWWWRRGAAAAAASAGVVAGLLGGCAVWGATTLNRSGAIGGSGGVDAIDAPPSAVAIVIDDTVASSVRRGDGTRMDALRDAATDFIDRLPAGTAVSVSGGRAEPAAFRTDRDAIAAAVGALSPRPVSGDLDAAVAAAATAADAHPLPRGGTIVFTTGTAAAVTESGGDDRAVQVWVPDVDPATDRRLSLVTDVDRRFSPDATLTIAAEVVTDTESEKTPLRDVAVELALFEADPTLPVVRDSTLVTPPLRVVDRGVVVGGRGSVSLATPPLAAGVHHAVVRTVGGDDVPINDELSVTLNVAPTPPTLVVAEDESEAFVLAETIADDPRQAESIDRVTPGDALAVDLSRYALVVAADPPAGLLRRLDDYVRGGGAVMAMLGPSLEPGDEVPSWCGRPLRVWRADPPRFIRMTASRETNSGLDGDVPWDRFPVRRYWQTEIIDPAAVVSAEFSGTDRHPAAWGGVAGRGRFWVLSTPLPALGESTRRWNDLFGEDPWPVWLWTRRVAGVLSGDGARRNVGVGGRAVIPVGFGRRGEQGQEQEQEQEQEQGAGAGAVGRWQLFAPGAIAATPLEVPGGVAAVSPGRSARPGTYFIRRGAAGGASGDGYSVRPDVAPEQWRALPIDELRRRKPGWTFVDDVDEVTLIGDRPGGGRRVPLGPPLMALAVIAVTAEQMLANRRRTG